MTEPRPLGIDVSALLRPGVFLLGLRRHWVYIGRARCILAALTNHVIRNRAKVVSDWLPIRAIAFDTIEIIPCDTARAHELATALIALHDPIHNRRPHRTTTMTYPPIPHPPTPSHQVRRI